MTEVKTAELSGPALDWATSKAIGVKIHAADSVQVNVRADAYFPVVTCRAIVATKFGDTVQIPTELVQ